MAKRFGDRSERPARSSHQERAPAPARSVLNSWRSRLFSLLGVVLASVSGFAVTNPGKWSIRYSKEPAAEKPPAPTAKASVIEIGVDKDSGTSVTVRICTSASATSPACPARAGVSTSQRGDEVNRVIGASMPRPNKNGIDSVHRTSIGCAPAVSPRHENSPRTDTTRHVWIADSTTESICPY